MSNQKWTEFYDGVYRTEAESKRAERPSGHIQYKGTDICVDLYCECGKQDHIDCDFLYYWQCSHCGKKYALSPHVALIPLTPEQIEYVETECNGFKSEPKGEE